MIAGDESAGYAELRERVCERLELEGEGLYVLQSKMRASGTFATEAEILAAATELSLPIYVCCTQQGQLRWQRHMPEESFSDEQAERILDSEFGIYLDNRSGNHFTVVKSVGL